ncbi:MAG: hypothetical protein AB7F67_03795 [Rhodospirillaceae bacterium]
MQFTISMAAAIAALDARVDLVDAAAGSPNQGQGRWWTGTPPASTAAARTGNLLAVFTLPRPAFGSASDNGDTYAAAAMNAVANSTAVGTGTAGYFDIVDGAGTVIEQGRITMSGESPTGDMVLDNTSIALGQTVRWTGYTAKQPTVG